MSKNIDDQLLDNIKNKEKKFKSSKTVDGRRIPHSNARMIVSSQDDVKVSVQTFKGISAVPDEWRNYQAPSPSLKSNPKYALVDFTPSIYENTTRPQNQQQCGSCFAFACATAVNDAFVFGQKLTYNPNISPLDIMSCAVKNPADICATGGNPFQVLTKISTTGIVTNHCVDYDDGCNHDPQCASEKVKDPAVGMVPPCGGCFSNQCSTQPHYRYKIKTPTFVAINDSIDGRYKKVMGNSSACNVIQQHLLKFGSAVTGFIILNNFDGDKSYGKFDKTNGIYFENMAYGATDPFSISGSGHAVVIVGWGVSDKPIKIFVPNETDPNKKEVTISSCQYWVVRNSWGTSWGEGGYFKIAMYQPPITQNGVTYEINPYTALERWRWINIKGNKIVGSTDVDTIVKNTPDLGTDTIGGGAIMVEPSGIPELNKSSPRAAPEYTNDDMKKFYCSDSYLLAKAPSPSSPPSGPSTPSPSSPPSTTEQTESQTSRDIRSDSSKSSKVSPLSQILQNKIWVAVAIALIAIGGYLFYKNVVRSI
jgi:C1A family cysteine protease